MDAMGSQHLGRVIFIDISKNDWSGFDFECINTLLDDFGLVDGLGLHFGQTDLNEHPQVPVEQIATLLRPGRRVYINGSLCDGDSPNPTPAVSSQKEDFCVETRRQIGMHACSLNNDNIVDESFSISKNDGFRLSHRLVDSSLYRRR